MIVVAAEEIALYEVSAALDAVTVHADPTEPRVNESVVPLREHALPDPTVKVTVPVPEPPEV